MTSRTVQQLGVEVRQLFVNGTSLSDVIARASGAADYSTLVPSWLCWTDDSSVGRDVRARTALADEPSRLPILFCPDDLDFTCTTVVVDVSATDDAVTWHRFGLDVAAFRVDRWRVGCHEQQVRWFASSPTYRFPRTVYRACIGTFSE